jgi:hypothetical protein
MATGVPQLGDDQQAEERQHVQRDGRALSQTAALHANLKRQRGEEVGRVRRSTAGEHLDDLEVGKRLDDGKQHDDRQYRHQQRDGNVPETVHGMRAVDAGSLVQVLRDGLEAGQQRDGEKGRPAPDVDGDDRAHGQARLTEKTGWRIRDVEWAKDPWQRRQGGIECQQKRQRAESRWHDVGQQDAGSNQVLERERLVHEQREDQAQTQLEDGRQAGVDERVLHRLQKHRAIEQRLVIGEPDELAQAEDLDVAQAVPHPQHERVGDEHGQ